MAGLGCGLDSPGSTLCLASKVHGQRRVIVLDLRQVVEADRIEANRRRSFILAMHVPLVPSQMLAPRARVNFTPWHECQEFLILIDVLHDSEEAVCIEVELLLCLELDRLRVEKAADCVLAPEGSRSWRQDAPHLAVIKCGFTLCQHIRINK